VRDHLLGAKGEAGGVLGRERERLVVGVRVQRLRPAEHRGERLERRAARYFAISSKKSRCALKKKLRRGAKSSTSRPRSSAASTYANPSASVNASSCAAVEPASRMW